MVHVGPHVLQHAPHLQLKTDLAQLQHVGLLANRSRQTANIVQRHVAETVDFQRLALVDGVFPINVEHLFHKSRNNVHLITEKCDDTNANNIRYIID